MTINKEILVIMEELGIELEEAQLALWQQHKTNLGSRPPECHKSIWEAIRPIPLGAAAVTAKAQARILERHVAKMKAEDYDDPKSMMTAMADLAVHQMIMVMMNPLEKGSVVLDASKFIIDHTVGKAKQEVEHSGSIAMELRKQANDYIAEAKRLGATPVIEMDKTQRDTEALINKLMPEQYVVGKKASVDEDDDEENL